MREFTRLASERADERVCLEKGYAGRQSYIGEVEQSVARFGQMRLVADLNEEQFRIAAEEVIDFVNARLLTTDIHPVIRELSATGSFRFSHRMPPGFHDKKDENRYGDLIIWEEIIGDLGATGENSANQLRRAVLISRDDKTDWVSASKFCVDKVGKVRKSNSDQEFNVKLAHPLLAHELAHRAPGNQIYITVPGFLASALVFSARKRGVQSNVENWLAASHRPTFVNYLADGESVNAPSSTARKITPELDPSLTEPPQSHELLGRRTLEASDDFGLENLEAKVLMSPLIASDLRQYNEAIPLEQPAIIDEWRTLLVRGDMPPMKFGRILAELSTNLGQSEQLVGFVERLGLVTTSKIFNELVLALIASAYFDRYGEPLARPKREIGLAILQLETNLRLKPAFRVLFHLLRSADVKLPYRPGGDRKPVPFLLDLVQAQGVHSLRDIRVNDNSGLINPVAANSSRRLSVLLSRTGNLECTGQEIRMLSSREFLIPSELLDDSRDKKKISWRPEVGLAVLDTATEGGLSDLIYEEDNDA